MAELPAIEDELRTALAWWAISVPEIMGVHTQGAASLLRADLPGVAKQAVSAVEMVKVVGLLGGFSAILVGPWSGVG